VLTYCWPPLMDVINKNAGNPTERTKTKESQLSLATNLLYKTSNISFFSTLDTLDSNIFRLINTHKMIERTTGLSL